MDSLLINEGFPLLSFLIFFPLAGALVLLFNSGEKFARFWTLAITTLEAVFSLPLLTGFNPATAQFQFAEKYAWVPQWDINYIVGVDGISILLVLLSTLIMPLCVLASWKYIQKRVSQFMFCLLIMQVSMVGLFVALDFILFWVFWEFMLIPMYLLIAVWGGPRKEYASIKFFIYTMAGSVFLLVAILALYMKNGSFFIPDMMWQSYSTTFQVLVFLSFFLAFAIKVPMFPLHTWLPDAHVEAPTAGSVILAGILLKMGTYGFFRFAMPLFPAGSAYFTPLIITLSVIGIIYGALVAMVQPDIKKLVAYSSVSHLGYCMLGLYVLTRQGVEGSVLQMINHGISTGALFLLVGVVYERRHTRLIKEYGGIARIMPVYSTIFMIVTLSSIGLPTTNGFIGEFLILLGTFKVNKLAAVLAASGVILGAVYMLWMVQRVFFGEVTNPKNKDIPDLNLRELAYLAPLVVLIFWIGLYPNFFLKKMHVSVDHFISQVKIDAAVPSTHVHEAAKIELPGVTVAMAKE
jgi:NADH-quinone oxidoreductase subunit M